MIGPTMRRLTSREFVGRAEQFSAMWAAFERAAGGEPGIVLVGGEAGAGKTRLVAELGRQAEAAGARPMTGGCVELAGGAAPLLPVIEALREAAGELGWGD